MEVTPPPIQAPTAKEKKYDRQLRLWAASGQRALEESHVLVVIPDRGAEGSGSSVAGIETLKNLVLPGIGSFTIADSATVTEADLGINFFLEADSLGQSRAKECTRLLEELNPDVKGNVVTQVYDTFGRDLESWLLDTAVLEPYNLIILCEPLPSKPRASICSYVRTQRDLSQSPTPIISLFSVGFYSTFSIRLPSDFPIVDTHPDPDSTQDLRLLAPWPELSDHMSSLIGSDITSLDNHDHGHIPYVILLLHYLNEWRKTRNTYPSTFREKTAFRDLVRSGARTSNPEGGEENYDEAAAAVLKTITPPEVNSGCKNMLDMSREMKIDQDTPNFWLIAKAIAAFYEDQKALPLPGSLPDMKSKSTDYVQLQNIYKAKARRDVAAVTETVRGLEKNLGRRVPDAEIEAFCKNANHVKIIQGTPLPQILYPSSPEDDPKAKRTSRWVLDQLSKCEDDVDSLLPLWTALELSRVRISIFGNHAPFDIDEWEAIATHPLVSPHLSEIERAAGGELHNISSIAGGMVAQEAIKVITKQYVPVDNTCVFDGVRGKAWVDKL